MIIHSDSTFSDFFLLETAWPIEARFYVGPPGDGGMKVWSNGLGRMNKMATKPINVKNLKKKKIIFSGTKRPMTLKVGMQHWVLEYHQVCSNDDPGMTLAYFKARSNLASYAFVWEKVKQWNFSETIVVYDIKVGRCSQLNEYQRYQRSRSFIAVQINQIQYF